ncbi:hypothetical protein, partial [Actinokineospora sp.]|uniref:hypothetical protein n=1 Tax=Actinokineospora sp. TaxID=1872133 RepID=UPI003D6A71F1
EARVLSGSGTIEANGGNNTTTGGSIAGAGGGGRVAVRYEDVTGFDLSKITAKPGDAATTDVGSDAGAGTVFLLDELNDTFGSLIVDSRGNSPAGVTPLRAIGSATSTALAANTLTRSSASFPVPNATTRAVGLVGLELNPNTAQGQTFTVISNTATTLTTDPADGAMTAIAAPGNRYTGVYTFDDFQVLGGANVSTSDDIVVVDPSADRTRIRGSLAARRLDTGTAELFLDTGTATVASVTAATLTLSSSSLLTAESTTTTSETRLEIDADTVTIDATSRIDVTSKGYLGGQQPGNAINNGRTIGNAAGSSLDTGGSYGGLAGGHSSRRDLVYGDFKNPDHPGSGGGGHTNFNCTVCVGGNGGGLVRIVADTIALNGRISANGG